MRKSVITGTILTLLVLLIAVPAFTETGSATGQKICLDPGHGGSDPGAIYDDGTIYLEEADINLDVAYGLKALLEADGAEVFMTRTDDSSKSNSDRYTFCNNEQATILVSVHTNSVTDSSWDGSLGLYAPMDDPALAQAIYDEMYPFLRDKAPEGVDFRDFGLDRFASGVLFKSDMPAAMMEPLFMSHPMEAELLVTPIYTDDGVPNSDCRRAQIAQAIHDGIVSYFSGAEPTPTPEPGGTMHVAAIDMWYEQKGPNFFVYTEVKIEDSNESPVSGAVVSVTTTQPNGSNVSNTDSAGDDGTVTFKLRSNQAGSYESTVTDVSKGGWVYDEAANVESSEILSVP